MLADGVGKAREWGCGSISLIPELDTDSQHFYAKCGLVRGKDIYSCTLPSEKGAITGRPVAEAPFSAVKELPFLFGLSQTAAGHMWQVFNRRPEGESRAVDTLAGDDFIIQLGGFSKAHPALLLAWGRLESACEIVRSARAFAYELGYPGVSFWFFPEMLGCFEGNGAETREYEMYLEL